ncbi:hypothetical protein PI93_021050 [Pandoraea fibrosis]|uniref:CS1 type fimbrial major subunit n=1 Tax=Pandoraea fibrosis TaxID=1891094 RepID=A0ABX6HWL4_9BURK|nr:CS1 type fimbrial major subunit [Pandoraea fibrosis]QHE91578.1 hypothetical protein PJ20_006950 [Pandoraea fibrosis]QHF14864.1 hypothetical protein PI93_021050 [Pandoraea fibrosis]
MKKSVVKIAMFALASASMFASPAHADQTNRKSFDIQLQAVVPFVPSFEVTPVNWNQAEVQNLTWDNMQKRFSDIALGIKVKSNVGNVSVKLADNQEPRVTHETDADAYYALAPRVNGKALTDTSTSIVNAVDAKQGKEIQLLISSKAEGKTESGAVPGKYAAQLRLVFETTIE